MFFLMSLCSLASARTPDSSVATAATSPAAAPYAVEINLSTRGDDIAFEQETLQVPVGPVVRLSFSNRATVGSQITHDVYVLMPGTQTAVLEEFAAHDYNLAFLEGDPRVLGKTPVLEPGVVGTLSVHFPAAGYYPFVCMMPGHGDMMGMRGIILAK